MECISKNGFLIFGKYFYETPTASSSKFTMLECDPESF